MQRYTIFFNKSALNLIISDIKIPNDLKAAQVFDYKGKEDFKSIVDGFLVKQQNEAVYISENQGRDALWNLLSYFKVESAAGGIVENYNEEILLIKRFGFYDFPKGHVETGETWEQTAVREVEEETGVRGLEIIKKLPQTFHVFMREKQYVLKETQWFSMRTFFSGGLKAQIEEQITEAFWIKRADLINVLPYFYPSLQRLLKESAYVK